jgi:hypothetical protein
VFSILLKKWSFGEEGALNKKKSKTCTFVGLQTLKGAYLAIQEMFYFLY